MVLVTGGTGFVGREVVRALLQAGYRVRVLARHPDPVPIPGVASRPEFMKGDVLRPETLPAAMAGVEAVVHLVGIIAETSRVSFEQAHVEATRNVLAAAQQAGVTRWLQMSAQGTRPNAVSRYHLTKWEAEESVRRSGLDWTIFRPSLIYGHDERDRLLNALRLALKLHVVPLPDGGHVRVQPVSVREVAACFARAVATQASLGRTYDLVGPEPFAWHELVAKVASALGTKAFVVPLPSALLLPVGDLFGTIAPRALQFGEQLKMALEDNVGDPRPAQADFSYAPETFEQGLQRWLSSPVP